MAISSTTQMLRVLGYSNPSTENKKLAVDVDAFPTDFAEKKLQLTPSPKLSMDDVLANCLSLQSGKDSTPLK